MDKFLRFMIIFLGSYLLLTWLFPADEKNVSLEQRDDIEIVLTESEYVIGEKIEFSVTNNLDDSLSLGKGTPPEKIQIEKHQNGEWIALSIADEPLETVLQSRETQVFSYPEQNTAFFNKAGNYRVVIAEGEKEFSKQIVVEDAGFFRTIWRTFFWKPIYNLFIGSLTLTGKNLGLAIIFLTLLIKLLLFIPTHKGMKAQRKMQTLQPELEKIKVKYAGNQQETALKTMDLWKKHKINPLASILPILLQFPVLIALFYVIQDGLSKDQSFFLYSWEWLSSFNYEGIITNFFNFLPLLQTPLQHLPSVWLPVAVAITQYFAMKLSFAKMKEQREKNKNAPKGKGFMAEMQGEFAKMSGVFVYVLPAMVLVFTMFLPAAVGLYWLVSTAFSIGQQYFVNKAVAEEVKV